MAESKKLVTAPKPAYNVLNEATAECSRKQEVLDKAARAVEYAKQQLEKAREAFDKATDDMVEAECALADPRARRQDVRQGA